MSVHHTDYTAINWMQKPIPSSISQIADVHFINILKAAVSLQHFKKNILEYHGNL